MNKLIASLQKIGDRQGLWVYERLGVFRPVFRLLPIFIYVFLVIWSLVVIVFAGTNVYAMLASGQPLEQSTWIGSLAGVGGILLIGFIGGCCLLWGARAFRRSYALYEAHKLERSRNHVG